MSDVHTRPPDTAAPDAWASGTGASDLRSGDTVSPWVDALAEFERATRSGVDFAPPQGLGPMPVELRDHAEQLLAACLARVAAVQAEMDEVDDELDGLRRSAARNSWTDDARGSAPGVGHLA